MAYHHLEHVIINRARVLKFIFKNTNERGFAGGDRSADNDKFLFMVFALYLYNIYTSAPY